MFCTITLCGLLLLHVVKSLFQKRSNHLDVLGARETKFGSLLIRLICSFKRFKH